jgi:hypothetical protein
MSLPAIWMTIGGHQLGLIPAGPPLYVPSVITRKTSAADRLT